MRGSFIVALAGILLPVALRAETGYGYTAEWIAHQADVIALATPVAAHAVKGPGDVWFTQVQFKIDDVIKGPLTTGDTLTVYDYSYTVADPFKLQDAVTRKRKLLIYVSPARDAFEDIEGKFIFTINHAQRSAYYLDEPVNALYTPEFGVLSDTKELIRRTREQVLHEQQLLKHGWEGTIQEKRIKVPISSELGQHTSIFDDCFLLVPEYEAK